MKTLLILLLCSTANATTQTVKQDRLKYGLQHLNSASQLKLVLDGVANVLYYDTYAELAAATPTEGLFGWAVDTNAMYFYNGTAWVAVNSTTSFTGAQGGTLDNATNNIWKFTEGATAEDLTLTAASNLWTFGSTTSATFAFTPATAFTGAGTWTGALYANGGIDRSTAAALAIGAANATSVVVTPDTTVTGALYGNGGLDRSAAAALAIGATNATAVNIGATATPVVVTPGGAVTAPGLVTGTGGSRRPNP